uniref:NADH-ubiquinone oxidoreductase chain 4 n=1 Tax=Cavenderia fasciculata TaxID=261658 RepID=B2XX63_CACFS|nr:NADH dehydrogenase subunit 4 [Cavenderia fasciculata]ABX45185.1 NADH dehydrogenase subunit 4 [Cavenderia fasciculata]
MEKYKQDIMKNINNIIYMGIIIGILIIGGQSLSSEFLVSNTLNIFNVLFIIVLSCLGLIHKNKEETIKRVSYWSSLLFVIVATFLTIEYTYLTDFEKIGMVFNSDYIYTGMLNINIGSSIDGIGIIFIWLTTLLIVSCVLISWTVVKEEVKMYMILLFIIEILLINLFGVIDLIHFYIIYESILIPIVIMISIWGSREEKKIAAYQIFVYTLIGSIFMLSAIGYIYYMFGTTDYFIIKEGIWTLSDIEQKLLFIGLFIGFAVKIPMVPLHLWLLRAHVEAPTAGSVLLAGILLKMGGYGFLRFNVGLFSSNILDFFFPYITVICIISILYTGIATILQLDIKKIIAYSSISHMNVVVLGIFSQNIQGIEGSVFLMVSHGFVSGSLFLCIGMIYEQTKSRMLYSYNNLAVVMPNYAIIFFLLTLANIAFPITSSFIGELLIFVGVMKANIIAAFFGGMGMIITVFYSFWLYNRLFFDNGMLDEQVKFLNKKGKFRDINEREFASVVLPLIGVGVLGVAPNVLLNIIHMSCMLLLKK